MLAVLTVATLNVSAQTEFLGLPGSSYIDNIADSQAIKLGLLADPHGKKTDQERFWTMRKVSATYAFEQVEVKRRDFDNDSHAFVPELYLESATGFSLNIGGLYLRQSIDDNFFGVEVDSNTYGVSVQPAYDVFTLWARENRPECLEHSRLIAGLGLTYGRTETEYDFNFFFFPIREVESDTFLLSPNLVFVQPITEYVTAFLIPAYTMAWTRTDDFGGSDLDSGLLTVTARGDYKAAEGCFVSAFATWKRNTHSKPSAPLTDWAEFGGQARFDLSQHFALRVGYGFEAFHPAFEAHRVFARLEVGF